MFSPYKFPKASIVGLNESLAEKVDTNLIGVAGGVASLDSNGLVPSSQLPSDIGGDKIKAFINESLGMTYHGYNVWTDGTDIYMSTGSTQRVLNRTTMQWESKTWTGLTNFYGQDIWTDGSKIYYSSDNTQYELDVATSAWSSKTWTGLTNYKGRYVWSDGIDTYYSKGTTQYVLDKTDPANPAWVSMTWVDFTNFDGNNVWTDGTDIYYSYQANHKKLTVATHTWTSMTWTGLTNYTGNKVWTDGTDVYYSSNATEYVLDIPNHNWVEKKWYGDTVSIDGSEIWSDGTDIHYANNSVSEKLVECSATDLIGVDNGIAELVNGRIPAENTNYVTAGLKSGVTRGTNATAEGYQTEPTGNYTHAEGYQCKATNNSAHAEGYQTQASTYSHSEGSGSKATGSSSHAEGNTTVASHNNSHAEGYYTQTGADYQHVQGKYNVGKSTTLFEIGNGTSTSNRANVFEVESDGDVIAAGSITDGSGNVLSQKPNFFYGETTSTENASIKYVTLADSTYVPQDGDIFLIDFKYGNSVTNVRLNINSSGDKFIFGGNITTYSNIWENSKKVLLRYDGTYYNVLAVDTPYMAKRVYASFSLYDANNSLCAYNGGTSRELHFRNELITVSSSGWSATVDSDNYYTNTVSLGVKYNTYNPIHIACCGSTKGTLPTAAQSAAYNICDMFSFADGADIQTMTVKAKTKPTETFYVLVQGSYME